MNEPLFNNKSINIQEDNYYQENNELSKEFSLQKVIDGSVFKDIWRR